MKPKMQVHFRLTGKFDPKDITKTLEIEPTKTWRFGESIQNTLIIYKHDGWCLSSAEIESLDFGQPLRQILTIIHPSHVQLTNMCKTFELDAEIACVIHLEGDQYPIIHFDREIIKQISDLNAEIDIDLY